MEDDASMMQISASIQPGNSGGALINDKGDVVGVTTSTANPYYFAKYRGYLPQNINYAVKAEYIKILTRNQTEPDGTSLLGDMILEERIKILRNYVCMVLVK
ncbi:MAG: serine protease [Saprospiraceae bacterium]|nr:serine protease [Saprospiraceae bacterium]